MCAQLQKSVWSEMGKLHDWWYGLGLIVLFMDYWDSS